MIASSSLMVSRTTLTIRPSLVVSLSTTTANDYGPGDYSAALFGRPMLLFLKMLASESSS